MTRPASFVPATARHVSGQGAAGVDEVEPDQCGHCGNTLPAVLGRGRPRKYCDATCRSRARRARTPPAPARCSVRAGLGRCATRSTGAWYDQRGTIAAHTCAEHREVAGDLLRTGMPRKRTLDRWLPANVRWSGGVEGFGTGSGVAGCFRSSLSCLAWMRGGSELPSQLRPAGPGPAKIATDAGSRSKTPLYCKKWRQSAYADCLFNSYYR